MSFLLKRCLDLGGALTALLVLSPAMAAIALLIDLTMGSPILFRQRRPGYKGSPFIFLKFRTMTDERAPDGTLLPDEKRLAPIGRLLRRTSLDELPQFWNVLRGDMSLVGPRPLLMEYLPLYTATQSRRHEVLPGIVGWATVNGRNAITWERKFALDVWYVDHRSLMLDLRILFMALGTVISGRGISEEGHATARKFTGSPEGQSGTAGRTSNAHRD